MPLVLPLSGLTQLEFLDLSSTQVTRVSPLENLAKLQGLNLDNLQVNQTELAELKEALPQIQWFIHD